VLCIALLAAMLAACANNDDAAGPANRLQACAKEPATCNAGERKKGGEITWLLEQPWGNQWNTMRTGGVSNYLLQTLAGTTPETGTFLPTGEWEWSRDLFVGEPKLVKEDPQTVEFVLRPEAVWSDGVPISVDDFRYNWFHNSGRADQCDGCDAADTTSWSQIDAIESNDRTVTVTYKPGERDAEWFATVGPSRNPAHIATKAGIDWHTPKGMGAASAYFRDTVPTWSGGPYLIQSAVADQRVILVPNPRWYGKQKPALTKVVKEVLTNSADWATALANGELDGGSPFAYDPDVAQRLRSMTDVSSAVSVAGSRFEHVDLNLKSPALADPALRKAILTALSVEDMRARLFGDLKPAFRTNSLFTQRSPHHVDVLAGSGFGTGDLTAARKLLADAGYTGTGAGQHLTKQGAAVPDLRFTFIAGHPTRGTFVEIAQQRLSEIGLTIKPSGVAGASQFASALRDGAFDFYIGAWDSGPLFVQIPKLLYRSDSGVNFAHLDDPAIDAAADAAVKATDVADAAKRANDVAKRLIADAFTLPLWEAPSFAFVRNTYVNIRDNPMSGYRAMYNLEAWGVGAG
jgi:peptide/nickel transport system substrate-binding protein